MNDDDTEKRRLITENSLLRAELAERAKEHQTILMEGSILPLSAHLQVEKVRELAETHRRFYRLDVLEEAARAMCFICSTEVGRRELPLSFGGCTAMFSVSDSGYLLEEVRHDTPDGGGIECMARPIRRLMLEEWR